MWMARLSYSVYPIDCLYAVNGVFGDRLPPILRGDCQPEAFRFDGMKAMDGSALRGLLPASSLLN